jgi:hypothetical protein
LAPTESATSAIPTTDIEVLDSWLKRLIDFKAPHWFAFGWTESPARVRQSIEADAPIANREKPAHQNDSTRAFELQNDRDC